MLGTVTDDISAVSDALAEKIGSQKYNIWFRNSTKMSLDGHFLSISVPNLFMAKWIEDHFAGQITQAVTEALGSHRKIAFKVDPSIVGSHKKAAVITQTPVAEKQASNTCPPAGLKKINQRQKLLRLENFVVGVSNELAYNAAKAVAYEKDSPFNPLFIHGGYGVGKTHLLQGICNAVSQTRPQTDWLYLSAEDFANQFVLALKTKKLDAFRRRMRQTDLLAIDDIHFLANKPSIQEEFLHTFNSIDLAGKQVVLVSDAHPKMIGQLCDKLVNRFVSGMVVCINAPDLKTRVKICRQYAAANNYDIPDSVIGYVAENIQTNVRELEGAILKVVAFASLQGSKITLQLAKEILAEHLVHTDPIVHSSDIESAVSQFFDITAADLHSPKKSKTIALARHFSMYLARKHTSMSSPEIGKLMGGKNHATVLLACKKIEDSLNANTQFNWLSPEGNRTEKAKTILTKLEKSIAD